MACILQQTTFAPRLSLARASTRGGAARVAPATVRPAMSMRSSPLARRSFSRAQRATVVARAEEGETSKPAAAETPEEEPIWVKREREAKEKEGEPGELPYGVYLLFSSFVVIAVVGSCFELANKNPLFGIIQPDSPLYYPILGVFILTGLPTASVLWGKAIKAANEETERMDRMDGY